MANRKTEIMLEDVTSVTKMKQELICPAMETPDETLYLSELDHMFPMYVSVICVYESDKGTKNPADVIKDALAKVLVNYYPVAGRLKRAISGKLEVECNGEGVLFAEAQANCALEDVCHLNEPYNPSDKSSLFLQIDQSQPIHNNPLLTIQVTSFKCGGFVVGIKRSHIIMDATGFSQFMKALGETAKANDGDSPSFALPVWERERLSPRSSPQPNVESSQEMMIPLEILTMALPTLKPFVPATFHFSPEYIQQLKQDVVQESNGDLRYCSSFEVLATFIWKTYAEAMQFHENAMGFSFIMNSRNSLKSVISGDGYYGNCFLSVTVKHEDLLRSCENGEKRLVKRSDVVRLIRQAKGEMTEEYVRSTIDYLDVVGGNNIFVPGYRKPEALLFNDWSRFGWIPDVGVGKAVYVTVGDIHPKPYVILLPKVTHKISVLLYLPQELMPVFKSLVEEHMK